MTDKGIKKVTSKKPLAFKIYKKLVLGKCVVANREVIEKNHCIDNNKILFSDNDKNFNLTLCRDYKKLCSLKLPLINKIVSKSNANEQENTESGREL